MYFKQIFPDKLFKGIFVRHWYGLGYSLKLGWPTFLRASAQQNIVVKGVAGARRKDKCVGIYIYTYINIWRSHEYL